MHYYNASELIFLSISFSLFCVSIIVNIYFLTHTFDICFILQRIAGSNANKYALSEQPDDKAFLFSESPLPQWAKVKTRAHARTPTHLAYILTHTIALLFLQRPHAT